MQKQEIGFDVENETGYSHDEIECNIDNVQKLLDQLPGLLSGQRLTTDDLDKHIQTAIVAQNSLLILTCVLTRLEAVSKREIFKVLAQRNKGVN